MLFRSGNTNDSNNATLTDSGNTYHNSGNDYDSDNTYHTNYHPDITENSNNTSVEDSRISNNEQHGLLNVNETHVLDDLHLNL